MFSSSNTIVSNKESISRLIGHTQLIESMDWSNENPDEILSASADGTIKVYLIFF